MPAAASASRRPTSAPAGIPSERATVRCARNGGPQARPPAGATARGVAPPAGRAQLAVDGRSECRQLARAVRHAEPQRPRPVRVRECAAAVDPDLEGVVAVRRALDRIGDRLDACFRRRPEEAQRQVEAVHADPADVALVRCHLRAVGADPLHDPGHRAERRLVQRHRHEQAAVRHPLRAPTSRSHITRSARRISSARAWSRQPSTSTVLSSSTLYVSKKCWISTRRCGRTCSSRSMCC